MSSTAAVCSDCPHSHLSSRFYAFHVLVICNPTSPLLAALPCLILLRTTTNVTNTPNITFSKGYFLYLFQTYINGQTSPFIMISEMPVPSHLSQKSNLFLQIRVPCLHLILIWALLLLWVTNSFIKLHTDYLMSFNLVIVRKDQSHFI